MVTDRLADMVSIINTGIIQRDQFISVKKSKVNIQILYVLYKNGVINNFQICTDRLIVFLKYKNGKSVLRHIKRYPSHNKKMQWSLKQWHTVNYRNSFSGFYILSTSIKGATWLNYKSGHFDLNIGSRKTAGIVRVYVTL